MQFVLGELFLTIVIRPLPGLSGPAHADGGDAPHGAHLPAEHGAAAGRETGQPGGEQRARLRPQAGRLRRILQQRSARSRSSCRKRLNWGTLTSHFRFDLKKRETNAFPSVMRFPWEDKNQEYNIMPLF